MLNVVWNRSGQGGEVSRRESATFVWDDGHRDRRAKLQLSDARSLICLQIAGQQQKIPLTGVTVANAHVSGTIEDLDGNGHISPKRWHGLWQPYEAVSADLTARGKALEAANVSLKLHGMQITGNGGDWHAQEPTSPRRHVEGHDLVLSKVELQFARVEQKRMED